MESRLTGRTRMLWLCNPHNPLGVVYSREWQQRVAQWAISRGLRIVSDEIWSDIVYTPYRHVSLASISPEIARNVVTIYGFSKNFALAGLRVGCVICRDPEWKKEIVAASDAESTVYGVSVLSQVAVIAALTDGRDWLAEFVRHLQAQRDYVINRLAKWPGVTVPQPQGTTLNPCAGSFLSKHGSPWSPALRAGSAPAPADICASALPPLAESCKKRLGAWSR
jgi:aspartate/methionine/tyrosine aminotransferase